MDAGLLEKGLKHRRATLGKEYVDQSLRDADALTRPFQEAMTAWCWGFGWGDEAIDAKTRSMMNLAMIGALGRMHEWELHCRGAIGNGVSLEEIRGIIHVVGIYCGVPQALECFRIARQVLEEHDMI
ncbi:MAG TPA: carboxymuconolactone decarboxylase family protein [Acidobacteriota bacterium]|nr:carboxymuconolactone decarboxylase family protein [Acidobacteriota bacterium]